MLLREPAQKYVTLPVFTRLFPALRHLIFSLFFLFFFFFFCGQGLQKSRGRLLIFTRLRKEG